MKTSMNGFLCLVWIADASNKMLCYVCRRCNFCFVGFFTDSKLIKRLERQKTYNWSHAILLNLTIFPKDTII